MDLIDESPRLSVGSCATLACLLEISAPKPGNVHRDADFEDMTFLDFVISAAVSGPVLEEARQIGVGATILHAVQVTRAAVGTNTNLGTILLLAPLAAVGREEPLEQGLPEILDQLDASQTSSIYEAIRTAHPGGLGRVGQADIHEVAPRQGVCQVMALAADRDRIARQYIDGFANVFQIAAPWIHEAHAGGAPLSQAIVTAFVRMLAHFPDSLIQRKCGKPMAEAASSRADKVLQSGQPGEPAYERALAELDGWLRADGHRRNPGTTADLIAAGLYVLLRENRIPWPIRFY